MLCLYVEYALRDLNVSVPRHSSATDMLWAGVPVLTTPARTIASRVAASLLRALDPAVAAALVAPDRTAYERRLLMLLADAAAAVSPGESELGRLRHQILAARASAVLFDTGAWVRGAESALRLMAERQWADLPPAPLVLSRRTLQSSQ
jgi:predicted O-linked N-acetylglucosamine transferase (SPINDLY family)